MRRILFLAVTLAISAFAHGAPAATRNGAVAEMCERAAINAARLENVPLSVLTAIMIGESGRRSAGRVTAWPWTVNMQGTGMWFDTRDAALAYVARHHGRGARSYDVGCFQINWRWHSDGFSSIEQMFDPRHNALYAARFLRELHEEMGDWSRAAGAYHSRTPKYSKRYRKRFDRLLAQSQHLDEQRLQPALIDPARRGSVLGPVPDAEDRSLARRAPGSLFRAHSGPRTGLFASRVGALGASR